MSGPRVTLMTHDGAVSVDHQMGYGTLDSHGVAVTDHKDPHPHMDIELHPMAAAITAYGAATVVDNPWRQNTVALPDNDDVSGGWLVLCDGLEPLGAPPPERLAYAHNSAANYLKIATDGTSVEIKGHAVLQPHAAAVAPLPELGIDTVAALTHLPHVYTLPPVLRPAEDQHQHVKIATGAGVPYADAVVVADAIVEAATGRIWIDVHDMAVAPAWQTTAGDYIDFHLMYRL
jgi:hypothetical protein